MEWQPISTAPKDGSWIIVTSTHNKYYRAAVRWEYESWIDLNEEKHDSLIEEVATHWMLLPSLPAAHPEAHQERR